MSESKPQRWWAIFPDYRDLTQGRLQSQPWEGGSNMTSDFEVVSAHHYDALEAKLKAAEAELERLRGELQSWNAISEVSGRKRHEIYAMAHQLKAGKYSERPEKIPSCNCSDPDNIRIHDEICEVLEGNAWNEDAVCTASVGIWAALKWYEKEREINRMLTEALERVVKEPMSAHLNAGSMLGYIRTRAREVLAREKQMREGKG